MVKVKVIFDYDATQPDELTMKVGDIISEVKKQPGGWWEGLLNNKRGVFPDNFVEDYTPPPGEPAHGPRPSVGKLSDVQKQIAGQIKLGPPPPMKNAPKPKQMAVVLFEYNPEQPDELQLMEGDQVEIVRMAEEGWWEGVLRGKSGMFPSNFVKLLDSAPIPVTAAPQYPLPGGYKQNDIGRVPSGGRPPAEKPKMPVPASNMELASPPELPTRNRGAKAKVIYSYHAQNEDELTLTEGQIVLVTDQKLEDPGWWRGELGGKAGVFPDNFVELLPSEDASQPPPGPLPPQQSVRGAAPRGPSVRINKPPPQLPPEPEPPAKLPPRPVVGGGGGMQTTQDLGRGMAPPMPKQKMEHELPPQPMVMMNGDDRVMMALRDDVEKLKSSMVTRESYELLQRELKATKDAFDSYKKDNNKKILDLMKEIDDGKKQTTQNNIELARIRKLAEDQWISK